MRRRYRGQVKAHLQHVFTAIAVNIERGLPPTGEPAPSRHLPPSKTAWTNTRSARLRMGHRRCLGRGPAACWWARGHTSAVTAFPFRCGHTERCATNRR
nr:transposase [Streptomyces flavidovirens]